MPYGAFHAAAESFRHDIARLGARFDASFEQVCHRLATLRRPAAEGVPLHFLRTDIAGNISKRFSASGLRLPRYGGACPRWIVHHAFTTPGRIVTQVAQLPDGETYLFVARAERAGRSRSPSRHAVMIGAPIAHAGRFAYADGLDLAAPSIAAPVGITCRQCPRDDCAERAFERPPACRRQRRPRLTAGCAVRASRAPPRAGDREPSAGYVGTTRKQLKKSRPARNRRPPRGESVAQSILVAEDERNLVEALSFLMQRAGYEVHVARDGPTTVQMARQLSPDLVLLDVMLPGFDGFAVAEAIRNDPGGKPPRIIMLTAKGHEKDRRKAIELGVDDYVTKPFSNRDVIDRVRALLAREESGP